MYNPELEGLIDAALADGMLTEKEKQILFKKAQAMGVDLDEFEMVLDARLVKLKKAEQEKAASSAPKSNKLGDVKKCPACGAMVQSYQGACPECGYAFENLEANLSSRRFSELIDKILSEPIPSNLSTFKTDYARMDKQNRVMQAIKNFPIPNTKADLMEFIFSLKPKIKGDRIYSPAYMSKYIECLEKARIMFPNDKDFAPLLASSKITWWNKLSPSTKITIISVAPMLILLLIGIILGKL